MDSTEPAYGSHASISLVWNRIGVTMSAHSFQCFAESSRTGNGALAGHKPTPRPS